MSDHDNQRPHRSQFHSAPNTSAVNTPSLASQSQSTSTPVSREYSFQPTIVLPSQTLPSTSPANQITNEFGLAYRGRQDPQDQVRRSSAALISTSPSGFDFAQPGATDSWQSQDQYQQSLVQYHARRSQSQPPRPLSYQEQQQQPSQSTSANMRYELSIEFDVGGTDETGEAHTLKSYRLHHRISVSTTSSHLRSIRLN